jgi:hypothetical protein
MFNPMSKSLAITHPFGNKSEANGVNNDSWVPRDPIQHWMETTKAEKKQLLHDLRLAYPHFNDIKMDSMRLRVAGLPFYASSGFRCYRLTDLNKAAPNQYLFLARPGQVFWHDMTNTAIYSINEMTPTIELDSPANLMAYARIFFHYVRGYLGCFIMAAQLEDIPWRQDTDEKTKNDVYKLLQPMRYQGLRADGREYLTATVIFKNALFKTDIAIAPRAMSLRYCEDDSDTFFEEELCVGQMQLLNEDLLAEDLPIIANPHPEEFTKPTVDDFYR